jgi:glutamyl-tRNA(Gln) amidotransferase subunit D
MKIGEKIRLQTKKWAYEGILLPRIEMGDKSSLVLKLDNGYNIGIKYDKGMQLKKIGPAVKLGAIPSIKLTHKAGLPEISLIATGGTIGTHVDYRTGAVFMCRTPEEIIATAPDLENVVNLKGVHRPFTLASEDMNHTHWQQLAELVAKELNKGRRGVIVTHGTDCLHYTAYALSFMLKNLTKPVAIVGAQRSPDRGSFDGVLNLICGGYFVGHSDIGEVAVVMHGNSSDEFCLAHRGTKVRKMHTSRRDAFRSINDLPLARIWPNGKIEILNENYRKFEDKKVDVDTAFEPKVAIVKFYPGCDPAIIDYYADNDYKGIVIEATGLGHVATGESGTSENELVKNLSWLPHIRSAIARGVVVVITSQTLYGRVHPFVYRNLRLLFEAGAIFGEDMLPETAYIKLGWLLGHEKDPEKVKNLMQTNLVGEISAETDYRSYLT